MEAEAASRAKDEFLAMRGHELRGPLGAIASAVAGLDRTGGREATARATRALIARQGAHMGRPVDDREMLRTMLTLEGRAVEEAGDGVTGTETALARRPDVVLADIGLPGMDGYEVARRIRAARGRVPAGAGRAERLRPARGPGGARSRPVSRPTW